MPTEGLVAHKPPGSQTFHLWKDGFTLCRRYGFFFNAEGEAEPVTDKTAYLKGQDCATCFRKAGLPVGTKEVGHGG